ncbi:FAD-binding oxidoreductase [Synechococcus sp. J7-Johnson]|uniref:FAD-binding oxidoreductase n=1 Tax=Synechococcus sp. J7-Johnson TaxID=2823737 RepID=UPI0020CE06B8|nr:FAD-binding oxidoreductase [Synechococcus sp. J7-Johnson]MCP9841061.1 FAD-binding oxidoreductase [Synechococcus sp. J7-Johnson]
MPLDPVTRPPALAIATQLPDDLPAPPTQAQLEALVAELSSAAAASAGEAGKGLVMIRSGSELERLSRDFSSYSPVLTPLLQDRLAQLVVKASSTEQVQLVAGACARHGVPITLRGSGTGNYGQCVPLAGGVVLDLSGLNRVRQLDSLSGVLTAEAGCLLADLEQQLAPHGRELRLTPSTRRSASLGGFIAGGSGGIGSVRWGFLRDPGNLLGLEVVTVEPEPRLLQLDASASAPLNHAYGSNGILTAVTVATAAAVPWQQLVVDFSSWTEAVAAIGALPATALLLNGLCLLEAAVARNLPCPGGHGHRLLLLAAADALPALEPLLGAMGGRLVWQAPERGCRGVPLRELCWNHTTLHMRAHDPGWTYLQMLLPQPEAPALEALKQRWGDDLLWHLEAVRQQGCQRLAALPLVRWRGPEALLELMEQARQQGALLFNPHVFTVEDGGLGVIDADQVAAKHTYDPAGLLNPGKLRGWSER